MADLNDEHVIIQDEDPNNLKIIFPNTLSIHNVTSLWSKCLNLQKTKQPPCLTMKLAISIIVMEQVSRY